MANDYIKNFIRLCDHVILAASGLVLALALLWLAYDFYHLPPEGRSLRTMSTNFGPCVELLLALLSALNIARVLRRRQSPSRHPVMRQLAGYGVPDTVAGEISDEVAEQATAMIPPLVITRSWLLRERVFALDIRPLREVVWIYQVATAHRATAYGIPLRTVTTNAVVICTRSGRPWTVDFKQDERRPREVLTAFAARAPWVLLGYDDLRADEWRTDPDRMARAVEERYTDLSSGVAHERSTKDLPRVQAPPPEIRKSTPAARHDEVRCWKCKHALVVSEENRGKNVRCPACGTKQKAPKSMAQPGIPA